MTDEMTMKHAAIAQSLTCSDCGNSHLQFEGWFGPFGEQFARYRCPKCQTSWPESARAITRQFGECR